MLQLWSGPFLTGSRDSDSTGIDIEKSRPVSLYFFQMMYRYLGKVTIYLFEDCLSMSNPTEKKMNFIQVIIIYIIPKSWSSDIAPGLMPEFRNSKRVTSPNWKNRPEVIQNAGEAVR